MSGSSPGSSLFKKNTSKAATPAEGSAEVPQVPVERIVASPRRQLGRGRRDTILTGADGVS